MTVIGDVIKTLGVALEGLAQAQAATTEALGAATKAHGLAEGVGGKGLLAKTSQLRDAVQAEAARLPVTAGNLERARDVAIALADIPGRDERLKAAGTLLSPNLRSSTANRPQRCGRPARPVRRRRTGFRARNGVLIGQLVLLGWLLITSVTDFPRWVDAPGILIITSVNLWQQLKYRTVRGVPSRWSRRDLRGEMAAMKRSKTKINRKLERAVRAALGAAVAGQGPTLTDVVTDIGRAGDEFTDRALDLVVAIGETALLSIHHGDRPGDQQLRIMTRDFVEYEAWAGIDFETMLAFLKARADRTPDRAAPAVPDRLFVACAIGGWLLSAFIPDEVTWTDFLDGILDRIECERADLLAGGGAGDELP
jgi:hypothetical protein